MVHAEVDRRPRGDDDGDGDDVRFGGAQLAAFTALYVVLALAGRLMSPHPDVYVTFWLPTGLYVATLLRVPTRAWPRVAAAGALGNTVFDLAIGTPPAVIALFVVCNGVQALGGAALVRRFVAPRPRLRELRELVAVVAIAGLGGAIVATGPVSAGLHVLVGAPFGQTFLLLVASCTMPVVLVTPLLLAWRRDAGDPAPRGGRIEAGLLALAMTSVATYLMVGDAGVLAPYKERLMPFLLWAGVRFGVRGAALASLWFGLLVAALTTLAPVGLSPAAIATGGYILTMQTFLLVSAAVALVPAVLLEERDRNLARLRDSEARTRTLASAAFEAILVSEGGRIVDVNDQALHLFGAERAQLIGTSLVDWVAPASRAQVADAVAANRDVSYENVLLRRDRTPFVAEAQARMMTIGGRRMRMTALRDVSERRRIEAELDDERVRLRAIVGAAMDAIVTVDQEGRIVVFNPAAERIFGCAAADAIGTPIERFLPGVTTAGAAAGQRRRGRRADGAELPIEASLSRIDLGEQQLLAVICRDVTAQEHAEERRQRLEAQLRQSQKMEAIGTLAGGIAHDFNNILTAIVAHAEVARAAYPDPRLRERLDQILQATQRAAALVRQILTFSRQQPHERRAIALAPVVREAMTLLRSTLPATITFDARIADGLPEVLADATQIHQVVLNLCANAEHAMRDRHGTLTVQLDAVQGDGATLPAHTFVRLTIADTGHGMDEATLGRIFDPFYTTKGPGEGTGLGLAVVHGIVEAHDGVITVESRPGLGTAFRILLPAAGALAAPASVGAPALEPPRGHGQHVLFVDDEPAICDAAAMILGDEGYQVTTFQRADAAWQAFAATPDGFDLVISDLTMPVMTGLELARKMLALRPGVPIVLTSGYSALGREAVQSVGVRELVRKPLDRMALLEPVARLLGSPGAA